MVDVAPGRRGGGVGHDLEGQHVAAGAGGVGGEGADVEALVVVGGRLDRDGEAVLRGRRVGCRLVSSDRSALVVVQLLVVVGTVEGRGSDKFCGVCGGWRSAADESLKGGDIDSLLCVH